MLIKVGIIGFVVQLVDVFLEMEMIHVFQPWFLCLNRLKNLNPRIELFSIFGSIDADFKEGRLFGGIALTDFNGLQNGWLKSDNKDSSLVTYFSRDWSNPLAIRNDSYIYFGNLSSRYGVSLASSIAIPANGDLILETSLKDSKSGETIVDAKVTYSVVTNKGFKKWKMRRSIVLLLSLIPMTGLKAVLELFTLPLMPSSISVGQSITFARAFCK